MTGFVYRSIHGVTSFITHVLDKVLNWFQHRTELVESERPESVARDAVLAALNGVMGDRLSASDNPLAIPMTLRFQNDVLKWNALSQNASATGKVLLMIHGLCMNDLQWTVRNDEGETNHGETLASELGYTPVYLRYNSGLHISENGRELSAQLEQMVNIAQTAIQELSVIAHSMGGLLIRSAAHYASQEGLRWPDHLKNVVFLGTPHHGAPLERAGNWVDVILERTRYTAPFARLGKLRSAGITDLRYGNLLDEDWLGVDRFDRNPDDRLAIPLPEGAACYALAATTAESRGGLSDKFGDGLVPVASALGQHDDPDQTLLFAEDAQHIVYRTNHMALLSSPDVAQKMIEWLAQKSAA